MLSLGVPIRLLNSLVIFGNLRQIELFEPIGPEGVTESPLLECVDTALRAASFQQEPLGTVKHLSPQGFQKEQ